jgi:hypothetical protein
MKVNTVFASFNPHTTQHTAVQHSSLHTGAPRDNSTEPHMTTFCLSDASRSLARVAVTTTGTAVYCGVSFGAVLFG